MKKIVIALGGSIILISFILIGQIVYNLLNQQELGTPDKTVNANVNVMITRTQNWRRIINEPVISENDMLMIDGSTATIPITAELLRQFWGYSDNEINTNNFISHSTTHIAYENLIYKTGNSLGRNKNRTVDLIIVTPPSDEEKQCAQNAGVVLDLTPIAKDGFVFITNKDNPVDSLTVEQIQGIYTGTITNWKQLGGEDLEIKAYQREKNSGSQTAMEQMVMQGKKMLEPINVKVYFGMGSLVDAVAEYENGKASIGYTYYYYINNLYKNDNIKVLKVNGITPENKNLLNNSYPFSTNYYAVIRSTEANNSPARKLRDFLITEKGQQLIEMAGYCRSVE